MKIFKVLCADVKTHLQVIAEDCSYNAACEYLASLGINFNNVKIKSDFRTNRTLIFTEQDFYIYDENRGLLLRD